MCAVGARCAAIQCRMLYVCLQWFVHLFSICEPADRGMEVVYLHDFRRCRWIAKNDFLQFVSPNCWTCWKPNWKYLFVAEGQWHWGSVDWSLITFPVPMHIWAWALLPCWHRLVRKVQEHAGVRRRTKQSPLSSFAHPPQTKQCSAPLNTHIAFSEDHGTAPFGNEQGAHSALHASSAVSQRHLPGGCTVILSPSEMASRAGLIHQDPFHSAGCCWGSSAMISVWISSCMNVMVAHSNSTAILLPGILHRQINCQGF